MKRRDLEKHLRSHGCAFHIHGARHDTWINLNTHAQTSIPRHNEIGKKGTIIGIYQKLACPNR